MKKIAIIGASELQAPLIAKAKTMGIETHVFAWSADDVGEKMADYFYPISIVEKEQILEECRRIEINGIASIASDLAMITVNYIANEMHLIGNPLDVTYRSTNKHEMRKTFETKGDPSPKSTLVDYNTDLNKLDLVYPVIVKPTDRSGSRGIYKLDNSNGLDETVKRAITQSFEKKALIEEFISGNEYSVEGISYRGEHNILTITEKFTTGAPHFIETGHLEPATLDPELYMRVINVVQHALDSLGIQNGASHTELKIDRNKNIYLIEIGGRMGGDFIGSNLVELSTGIDYIKAVIDIALGDKPDLRPVHKEYVAGVRFVFSQEDLDALDTLKQNDLDYLVMEKVKNGDSREITDSSNRHGWFIMCASDSNSIRKYLPKHM